MFVGAVPLIVRLRAEVASRKEREHESWTGMELAMGVGVDGGGGRAQRRWPWPAGRSVAGGHGPDRDGGEALSSTTYGSVLVVGGTVLPGWAPLYLFSGDADGKFGCTTKVVPSAYNLGERRDITR